MVLARTRDSVLQLQRSALPAGLGRRWVNITGSILKGFWVFLLVSSEHSRRKFVNSDIQFQLFLAST